jgi:hypothetical protein
MVLVASPVLAAGKGQPKVSICHLAIDDLTGLPTQRIIAVPNRVVPAHIARHGDYLVGSEICDGIDNDCDGSVDEDDVCTRAVLVCNCFYPEGPESLTDCLDHFDQCESAESLCSERCSNCFGTPERSEIAACEVSPDCRAMPCFWEP